MHKTQQEVLQAVSRSDSRIRDQKMNLHWKERQGEERREKERKGKEKIVFHNVFVTVSRVNVY